MNDQTFASGEQRRQAARHALEAADRTAPPRLRVRCSANHHVADVVDTDLGAVYRAVTGRRAHGSRDDVDAAHRGASGAEFVDLLDDPTSDDALPASCECGPRRLSRRELLDAIGRHERRMLLT